MNYEVIADRDKGDDLRGWMGIAKPGDRIVEELGEDYRIATVRIERPVPTTNEPMDVFQAAAQRARSVQPTPHSPTREQIAEAIATATAIYWESPESQLLSEHIADAVLALIQNGADR